jgi:hypothetical protein
MKRESSTNRDLRLYGGIVLALGGAFAAAAFFSFPFAVEILGGAAAVALTALIGRRSLPPWRGSKNGQFIFLGYAFIFTAIVVILSIAYGH